MRKAVKDVIKTVETIINPFENDKQLVHLASRAVATPAVAESMKTMLARGKVAADNFIKTTVVEDGPDIYATIKKTKLETFSSMGKKVINKKKKGKLVELKNPFLKDVDCKKPRFGNGECS